MKSLSLYILIFFYCILFISCTAQTNKVEKEEFKINKTDSEWKALLSKEQYYVLREKGTEPAFSGKYLDNTPHGTYHCVGCGTATFGTSSKFNSNSGWPSFWQPIDKKNIKLVVDKTYGMIRKEVVCAVCGGHLGHVFDDGPKPTGLRYCINSAALDFKKKK